MPRYRIGTLTIHSVDVSVREMHVLYSTVYLNSYLHNRKRPLELLSLQGSFLGVSAPALGNMGIDLVTMNDSALQITTKAPFAEARIGKLAMTRTAVISSGDLFLRTDSVVLQDSWMQAPGFASNASSLCYNNVTFNCACWDPTEVAPNICEDNYSRCQEGYPLPTSRVLSNKCQSDEAAASPEAVSRAVRPLLTFAECTSIVISSLLFIRM